MSKIGVESLDSFTILFCNLMKKKKKGVVLKRHMSIFATKKVLIIN